MPYVSHWRILHIFQVGMGVILAFCCTIAAASAQPRTSSNRVDNLRRALDSKGVDPGRQKRVQQHAAALRGITELRQALELPGWREAEQPIRRGIVERFLDQVAEVVKSDNLTNRLSAATVVGEMGPVTANLPAPDETYFTTKVTPLLANLMTDRNPQVRETAARSLSRINADPKQVAAAYQRLLEKKIAAAERRLAAEAVLNFIALKIQVFEEPPKEGIKVSRKDLVALGESMVPLVGRGLQDPDVTVRRLSLRCIQRLAEALTVLVPVPKADDRDSITPDVIRKEWDFVRPLVEKLGGQGKTLADLLRDSDAEVRLLVRRALNELARARLRLRRRQASLARTEKVLAPRWGEVALRADNAADIPDILGEDLQPAVKVIAQGITDPSPEIRLAAVEFLELLEDAAAPAAPALIRTLSDPNPFVRWAAARTLGRIRPVDRATTRKAVPGLARLLADPDLDLRLAAAATLAEFGADAAPAVPALIRASQTGDAEIRMAAMQTLVTVGLPRNHREADKVVAAVTAGLKNVDARVRQTAAETLGAFGHAARSAIPALEKALNDETMEVRTAASGALLDIGGK